MTAASVPRVTRASRPRGSFGLDDRRWPDPARVEAVLRRFLAGRLPDVWPLPIPARATSPEDAGPGAAADADGRTLTLLLTHGHVAVLRIERDPAHPGPACRALVDRCRAMEIPHATVSSIEQGRSALRRLGVEPRPQPQSIGALDPDSVFGRR